MSLDTTHSLRSDFLESMSRAANTVTLLTTDGPAGRDGMTITAMSSVSADGALPVLLVCVKSTSRPAAKLLKNGRFCLNILSKEQRDLADIFAGRKGGQCDDWFASAEWHDAAPLLKEASAGFDCKILEIKEVGSHYVIFGGVEGAISTQGKPLLYYARGYNALGNEVLK